MRTERASAAKANPSSAGDRRQAPVTALAHFGESAQPLHAWSYGDFHIQPKLTVGAPDDPHERQADAVAARVMRMPGPVDPLSAGDLKVRRKCSDCKEEEEDRQEKKQTVSRKETSRGPVPRYAPAMVGDVLAQSGAPLDPAARTFFEPRFGFDFSQVRLHTSQQAEQSASSIQARAYTAGHQIVFGAGQYAPDSSAGRELLAHELAHVVQQEGGGRTVVRREPEPGEEAARRDKDEVFASLYGAIYSGVESHNPRIRLDYAESLAKKYEEFQATGDAPRSRLAVASVLNRIYLSLQSDQSSAKRDTDGALLTTEFADEVPWTKDRTKTVSEIPIFTPERIIAWSADSALYARQQAAAQPGTRAKKAPVTAPPGFSDLVTSGPASAAPAPASSGAGIPAAPSVAVKARTEDEKDNAKDVGSGPAVNHGLQVLKSRKLSSVKTSAPDDEDAKEAPAVAADKDTTLLDASAQIWFISNRLYLLDRTGHLEPREESWLDVSSLSGLHAGGVYFVIPVDKKVAGQTVNFRYEALEGSADSTAGIRFQSVLTGLIPALELNSELAKKHQGVGLIVAPTYAKKQLTVGDISLDKLLQAMDRVPGNMGWAINAEVNRIKGDPLGEVANQALAMGVEYLSKFIPGLGQGLMAYQLIRLAEWLGEVGNIAAYAQTKDETDIAAQAIARKLAQFLVFEAISRTAKAGIKLGTGALSKPKVDTEVTGSNNRETKTGDDKPVDPVQEHPTAKPPEHVSDAKPAINQEEALAHKDLGGGHEAVVTKDGVGRCSPGPCPVIGVEFAKELDANPKLKEWNERVQELRKTDANKAAEEGAALIRTCEAARNNAAKAAPAGADEPIFTLGVGKERLEQIQAGNKNFVGDRRLTFDVDEVLPVGAKDIKPQRAYKRATDAGNRQLLDPNTNQRTKGLGIDAREIGGGKPVEGPRVSVANDANALLTRRFSEVHELNNIFDRAVASVKNPQKLSPTELKAAINGETRRIITEDPGPDAVAVRKALGDLGFERQPGVGWVLVKGPPPAPPAAPAAAAP